MRKKGTVALLLSVCLSACGGSKSGGTKVWTNRYEDYESVASLFASHPKEGKINLTFDPSECPALSSMALRHYVRGFCDYPHGHENGANCPYLVPNEQWVVATSEEADLAITLFPRDISTYEGCASAVRTSSERWLTFFRFNGFDEIWSLEGTEDFSLFRDFPHDGNEADSQTKEWNEALKARSRIVKNALGEKAGYLTASYRTSVEQAEALFSAFCASLGFLSAN